MADQPPVTIDQVEQFGYNQRLIPEGYGVEITDHLESDDDDIEWFMLELHKRCEDRMNELSIRRKKVFVALATYRQELENVAAPAVGPSPRALDDHLENRTLAKYNIGVREIISQMDELVGEAHQKRGMTAHEIREALGNYALTLDYLLSSNPR